MRASLYTALIALTLLSWTAPARAHHVVSESGIAWVEPVSVFQVDVQTARFDLGGSWRGQWSTLTPSLEWRLHERFSLMGRLPVAMISLDDGRAVAGLADAGSVGGSGGAVADGIAEAMVTTAVGLIIGLLGK